MIEELIVSGGEIKESTHRMSIKGTSVEVIVVLVVFLPPLYVAG